MLRFFRTIRQRLLSENRFTRYLIYALGEIILVIAGILIALQINNWNEEAKQRALEHKLLAEMIGDLEHDHSDAKFNIKLNRGIRKSCEIILKHLDDRQPYSDSLEYHYANIIGHTTFVKNTSSFQNLKSLGFNIVSNDTLRRMITNLYTLRYEFITNFESEIDGQHQQLQIYPEVKENITTYALWEHAVPIDHTSLFDNQGFQETLRFNIKIKKDIIWRYERMANEIQALIGSIKKELDKEK